MGFKGASRRQRPGAYNGRAGIKTRRARVDVAVERIVKTLLTEGASVPEKELDFVVRMKFRAVRRERDVLELMRDLFVRPPSVRYRYEK